MKIAEGLEMLDLPAELADGSARIYPSVFYDDKHVLLVDAGLPDAVPFFREAFSKAGIDFERIGRIAITHSDMDHIGSLSEIISLSSHPIEVLAHAEEKPYIQTERPPIRMEQMKGRLEGLPEERRSKMQGVYDNIRNNYRRLRAEVTHEVEDGEALDICGGITVIYTPGHTPGHICLYHPASKTLVAGDCLNIKDGQLIPSPAFLTLDADALRASLIKLSRLDIQNVVCYHGGLYKDDANARIAELAQA